MKLTSYPCPLPGGAESSELAIAFDSGRACRVLIAPPLFDELNRMRRFCVDVLRRLDKAGYDAFLPDLPGCNESQQDLALVELEDWRMALEASARHFGATHVLAIRGGALLIPAKLPGWAYAPVTGASLLKTMMRARILSSREAGREESIDHLRTQGFAMGLDLAGYSLSGEMLRQLDGAVPARAPHLTVIDQETVGGSGLWLRAEPAENAEQADAVAAIVAIGLSA